MKIGRIPFQVYLLGLVSLFNDTASEMLYPVMPIFLTQVLGAPVYVIGIIDGVAEGLSSVFKTFFGIWSDKLGIRKPFVVSGYGASAISKIIIALSGSWPLVFLGRSVDRFGKGLRTGARDALLLSASTPKNKGLVFGIHRSFDSAGAVLGPLIALYLLSTFHQNIRLILYIATIPSFLGLLLFFFLKEKRSKGINKSLPFSLSLSGFPKEFIYFLAILAIFSLGNSSDSFLILQSKNIGLSLISVVGVYIIYNLFYTLISTPAGLLADKIGSRYVFAMGLVIFSLVYTGFAFNKNPHLVIFLFGIYGAYIAFTDGVSKALIAEFIPKGKEGTAYGINQTILSITTVFASVIGGFLWTLFGSKYTFLFGSICSVLALILYLPKLLKSYTL